jgi:ketopantoate reductase
VDIIIHVNEGKKIMKTLIVGAGIIGTIYGWALHEAGADVTHFIRNGKSDNYKYGITIDILDERKDHKKYNKTDYPVKCVEEISQCDNYELVIVATNYYQTQSAIRQLYPMSPDSFYLIMAANWEGAEFIEEVIPRKQYLLAYPDAGGVVKDGVYWTNIGAELHIEGPGEGNKENFDRVAALFGKADIKPDIQDSMLYWLWLHNAMSTGIWAAYLKYKDVKLFLKDNTLLKKSYTATMECLKLCEKRGIELKKFPDVQMIMLPKWLFIITFKLLWTYNESMKRFTAHAASGYKEAKANYDAIMKTARELNFEMPAMTEVGQYL